MDFINKRARPKFSAPDAPVSPRMGPNFRFGSDKPIQLSISVEWVVHRYCSGGGLFTDILKSGPLK